MALTKINYYLIAVALILIGVTSMVLFGNEISTKNTVTLDQDSQDYINDFQAKTNLAQITNTTNKTKDADADNPFSNKLANIPIIGEILGVVSIFIEVTKQIWSFLVVMYNIPSFIIQTLGLPIGGWQHVINVLAYMLLAGIIITFVRLLR